MRQIHHDKGVKFGLLGLSRVRHAALILLAAGRSGRQMTADANLHGKTAPSAGPESCRRQPDSDDDGKQMVSGSRGGQSHFPCGKIGTVPELFFGRS